jgi:hypothetical protein
LVCYNLGCIIISQLEPGIAAEFWKNEPAEKVNVLPLVRPG